MEAPPALQQEQEAASVGLAPPAEPLAPPPEAAVHPPPLQAPPPPVVTLELLRQRQHQFAVERDWPQVGCGGAGREGRVAARAI